MLYSTHENIQTAFPTNINCISLFLIYMYAHSYVKYKKREGKRHNITKGKSVREYGCVLISEHCKK